jgi:hypothetical protein
MGRVWPRHGYRGRPFNRSLGVVETVVRGKEAAAAAALSLIAPGSGHLYLGRAKRFAVPFALFTMALLALGVLGLISTLAGFTLILGMGVGLVLFTIIDAVVLGARVGRANHKWYMRWFVLVAWVLACLALNLFWVSIRESVLGYATYRISSVSMRPTLAPGDIVLVNTRLPAGSELETNTLVVFHYPNRGGLNILRVKQQERPGSYSLSNGLPFSPTVEGVSRENISGVVTALLWSPERKEFGHSLR